MYKVWTHTRNEDGSVKSHKHGETSSKVSAMSAAKRLAGPGATFRQRGDMLEYVGNGITSCVC